MGKRISAAFCAAKARKGKTPVRRRENGAKVSKNANDHEQVARVHPALPSYSWPYRRRSF
jgi:hypothetical protein